MVVQLCVAVLQGVRGLFQGIVPRVFLGIWWVAAPAGSGHDDYGITCSTQEHTGEGGSAPSLPGVRFLISLLF